MYEFKDCDRILVTNEDEYEKLLSLLHEQGYEWAGGENLLNDPSHRWGCLTNVNFRKVIIRVYNSESRKRITWDNTDIILFEKISGEKRLTASEVIRTHRAINEMCCRFGCDTCPIGAHDEEYCDTWQKKHPEETIAAIQEYIRQEEADEIHAAIKLCEEHGYTGAAEVLRRV